MYDPEEFAVAMDEYPHLNEEWRDRILKAVELAPYFRPSDEELDDYFESPAYFAWTYAGETYLSPPSYNLFAHYVTLEEAAGYESVITKAEILGALHRGLQLVER